MARIVLVQDFSGELEQWQSFQPSGAMSLIEIDSADQWHRYTEGRVGQVDANGHVERIEYDPNNDGRPDQWGDFKPASDEPCKV